MGNPKTRLKDFLTKDERTFITKYMLTNILNEVSQLNDEVMITLWIYPNIDHPWLHELKAKYKFNLKKQIGSSLCERMNNCLSFESSKNNKTILIGSDIPSLSKSIIMDAIHILSNKDIVIGPSLDGGFYLIGVNRLFKDTIDCTKPINILNLKKNITSQRKSIGLLRALKDIDTPEDLLII
ncbi:MAG: DUF2064 domain-containing protein [Cryomorphaceae bacterium]|nr:DUF2064 domain-containing protein [Cryomorphaceae bacterium]